MVLDLFANPGSEFCEHSIFVGFQLKYKPDVVAWMSGCNMHVEMKNCLSCNPPVIGEYVEALKMQALHHCTGDDLGGVEDIVQVPFRDREEIAAVFLRYYQRMAKVNRVDIKNGDDLLVLKKDFGWQSVLNYVAEDAIHGLFSMQGEHVQISGCSFHSE